MLFIVSCGEWEKLSELSTFKKTKQLGNWKNGRGCLWSLIVNIGDATKCLKDQLDQEIAKCQTLQLDLQHQTIESAKLQSKLTATRELSKNATRGTTVHQRWQDYSNW